MHNITFIVICMMCISHALTQVPLCQLSPVDPGDPESIQRAQLVLMKCQIDSNNAQFNRAIDAITSLHNDSIIFQAQLMNAIASFRRGTTIPEIFGYSILSILITTVFYQILKIIWFLSVQHVDCLAELLMLLQHLRSSGNSAIPTYDTKDEFRRARSVPILLVAFRCCGKKTSSEA